MYGIINLRLKFIKKINFGGTLFLLLFMAVAYILKITCAALRLMQDPYAILCPNITP